jgi:hypothetical protein
MIGLCAYSLFVIFNELKVYYEADRNVSHLFFAVLFACQFILCFPCALNQSREDFEPAVSSQPSATPSAAVESNLSRIREHARFLRTKNILSVLLINLWAVPYLLYFQKFEAPAANVSKIYAVNHILISCVMVYRLVYYHREYLESQAASASATTTEGGGGKKQK